MVKDIVVMGSGNVATHLAKVLYAMGLTVMQVYSRNPAHAEALAKQVDAEPVSELSQLTAKAHLYLICVSDRAIAPLIASLNFEPAMVAHTSGSMSLSTLAKFKNHGVFYPLQTFSKERRIELNYVPFFIEGSSDRVTSELMELAHKISDYVFELDSDKRLQLHLAAVFANNFVNHFYGIASQILEHQGVQFNLLEPLLTETLQKALEIGPDNAQTGPAIRGDVNVMKHHQSLINNAEIEKLYSFVSDSIYKKHVNK